MGATWAALAADSRRAAFLFWSLVLVLGVSSRLWIFDELDEAELPVFNELVGTDMETFLNWARILVEEGRWLTDFEVTSRGSAPAVEQRVFHQSPLYPYLLALGAKALSLDLDHGRQRLRANGERYWPTDYLVLLRIQQLLGLVLLWPLHQILRRLSGLRVARIGTLLLVFDQASALYEMTLLRALPLAFAYSFLAWSVLRLAESPSGGRFLASGLWLGLAWLIKASSLVFLPVILAWIVWQRPRSLGGGALALRLALLVAGVLVVLSPAVVRNLHFDLPPFQLTTRGPLAYINGNSHLGYRDDSLPRESVVQQVSNRGLGWNIDVLLSRRYDAKFLSPDSSFARAHLSAPIDGHSLENGSGLLRVMRLVWAEHTEEGTWLSRFAPMMGLKLSAFFNGFELPNNVSLGLARRYVPALDLFFLTPFVVCAVFVAGVLLLVGRWKEPAVSLLLALVLTHVAATVAFYFIGRFRFPVLPLMFVLGFAGLAHFARRWTGMRPAGRALGGAILLASAAFAWPRDVRGGIYQQAYETYGGLQWSHYLNYALALESRGRWSRVLDVSGDGLGQEGFEGFLPLWSLHFEALAMQPSREEERTRACRLFFDWASKALDPPAFPTGEDASPSLRQAVYYSFAAEQLAVEASRSGRKREAGDFARRALEVREVHGRALERARASLGLQPWLGDADLAELRAQGDAAADAAPQSRT